MNAKSKYTLGIETATPVCSAAIVTREKSVAEYTLNTASSHEPHLMPMIERILCDTDIELRRLSAIAVSTGPGSFTGLRIGLATAKGLALAQDIPLIGIPTLDGLSYNVVAAKTPHPTPRIICPLIDARKGEVYSALYRYKEMEKLTDYMVLPLMELLKQITEPTLFTGHIHLYREKIEKELGAHALFAPPKLSYPKAASIAHLGTIQRDSCTNELKPIYLRKARAEEQLEITIGEMTEEDIPQVMAIEKESFPSPWSEDMFRSKHRNSGEPIFLVAKLREKILGYICGWALHDELHLGNIAIQRDFRSRGISKRLLQRIIDIARSREITLVTLEVRAGNAPAQNLYRKFGFDITDRHREYYQDTKEDAIVMSLNLLNLRTHRPVVGLVSEPDEDGISMPRFSGSGTTPNTYCTGFAEYLPTEKMISHMTTWAEIDLGTAKNNVAHVKEIVGKDVTIIAVVKADAYSHGAPNLANAFLKGGAKFLAVATVCEGTKLRSSHIDAPVIILNPPLPDELNKILEYGLTPVVDDLKICELLNVAAELARPRKSKASFATTGAPSPSDEKVKIHVEVDTGMGRSGFFPGEVVSKIKRIRQLKNIIIEGIFTHFSSAENDRDFTMKQIAEFKQVLKELDSAGINIQYRHCANCAGVLAFPESFFNMVRPGLCLYGISPFALSAPSMQTCRGLIYQTRGSDKSDPYKKNFIKPVLTLKSRIVHKREVPKGTPLSYGRTHITTRKSCIATLPIGYADGYSRNLSNKAEVLVKGKRVPVVGRICMDRCLIDITDMPEVEVGDEVILIGKQARPRKSGEQESISVEELAQKAETIPHEFISRIGKRVPRIYIDSSFHSDLSSSEAKE